MPHLDKSFKRGKIKSGCGYNIKFKHPGGYHDISNNKSVADTGLVPGVCGADPAQ
jgi:hypothetical protein